MCTVTIFERAWHNGSPTIMAKPVRALEWHHQMIQLFMKEIIQDERNGSKRNGTRETSPHQNQ